MSQTVYQDIGGRDAVEAVVADFYDEVLSDDQLIPYFEGMEMSELRAHQVQFISSVAGGPVEYAGDDMRAAHAHLDIDEADFEAVGEYLHDALERNGVEQQHIERIMSEVATLKAPILGEPSTDD